MVKTIQGNLEMDELVKGLTEFVRKLPDYQRVVSDTFGLDLNKGYGLSFELKEPYEEKCWHCDGAGKVNNGTKRKPDFEPCDMCDGTGKQKSHRTLSARVSRYDDNKRLRIEVNTEGKKEEVWKPDVGAIKAFLEGLVGKEFISVPIRKGKEPPVPLDQQLQQSLDSIQGGDEHGIGQRA